MTTLRLITLAAILTAAATSLGCDSGKPITKPTSFAPPPNPKDPSLKGDTAPGPP